MRPISLILLCSVGLVVPGIVTAPASQAQSASAVAQVAGEGGDQGSAGSATRIETSGSVPAPKWTKLLRWSQPNFRGDRTVHARVDAADPNQTITFYAGLRRPERKAEAAAAKVATPGSKAYRHHWSLRQIRLQLGVQANTVAALRAALAGSGVSAQVDPTRVFARLSGSTGAMGALFGTPIVQVSAPTFTVFGPATTATTPPALQGLVTELIPFYAVQSAAATAQSGVTPRSTVAPSNQGSPARVCKSLRDSADGQQLLQEAQTFQQGAIAYGAASLQQRTSTRGDIRGFDPRVGVISMGDGFSEGAARESASCFKWSARSYETQMTDGMNQPLAEGIEGDLDVQMAGAIMSSSRKIDYFEALPWQPNSQVLPIAAAFNAKWRPDVLSVSYGICEAALAAFDGAGAMGIANSIYLRLGLAGTSVLAAAGDTGSAGCARIDGSTSQAVLFPSTSPWVTAVGGTRVTLNRRNQRRGEVAWNDSNFVGGELTPSNNAGAGGGGASVIYARPSWQRTSVTHVATQRAVPDIAAHSSGAPGWVIGFSSGPGVVWGTSSATPLVAASVALLNAQQKQAGHPTLGFLNPWLYSIRSPRNSAFFDIVSGSTDLTGNGCCTAARGYDQATGLGSPNFAAMRKRIAAVG